MRANPQPDESDLEIAVAQAIMTCNGDLRATIRAMIVANEFLKAEVCELMQAVSHAYARGRLKPYSG